MKQKLINFFEMTGLTWFLPVVKFFAGEDPRHQVKELFKMLGYPALAVVFFFLTWSYMSTKVRTSVGQLPGPTYVWSQAKAMWSTHLSETVNKEESAKLEQRRIELNKLVSKRTALEKEGKDSTKVNSQIKSLLVVTKKEMEFYEGQISSFSKIHKDAEEKKNSEIDNVRQEFVNKAAFEYDKDGKKTLDVDGQPKLNQAAMDTLNSMGYYRVAVYEGNMARVYTSTQSSYKSLINKIEKIETYYAKAIALASSAEKDAKKIAINNKRLAAFEKQLTKANDYQGNGSIVDYIKLSIITVLFGFFLAVIVAVPVGILCGLSPALSMALNPLIQTFRPVSPLAWVLITMQFVDGIFVGDNALTGETFNNPFLVAGITVALCSLWPTLSNTALGVSSVDQDHLNVAKVLKLSWFDRVFKIVIPSAIPYIFTGLRITLGVGWMVLIVSEMMATSRGLGWFIDLEYQNNKVESLANIIVCIFIIGFIGAVLDRVMYTMQKLVSFSDEVSS
jgi:nitrate/nitrite transport system permease protein